MESREYFGRIAGQWDEMRQEYFREEVREAAIARAGLTGDMVVADVGSGTGFMAAGLAPLVKAVICVDSSPEMLEVARRNLAGFDNVTFQVAEGDSLPVPTGRVDAIFANMYLHHAPDPAAAISEMVRVLRPGGRILITDEDRHDNEWQRTEMADLWLGFEREQIRAWYSQAGLVEIGVEDTGDTWNAVSDRGQRSSVSVFVATGRKPTQQERLADQADSYFMSGYNWTQSVLQGLQGHFGCEDEDLWKIVTGLGAGMSRRGYVCGALTGGIIACGMAVAARRGSSREDVVGLREETYRDVQELTRRFEARFGSVDCRQLVGCDFLTPEGQRYFQENHLMDRVCGLAVRFVVSTVVGIYG